MKNINQKILIGLIVILIYILTYDLTAHAAYCSMGDMLQSEYNEYIAWLGMICGLVFCLGINQ